MKKNRIGRWVATLFPMLFGGIAGIKWGIIDGIMFAIPVGLLFAILSEHVRQRDRLTELIEGVRQSRQ
jgi:hypothetical protein